MRGLDTNVLLRYFLRDEEHQWKLADRYIRDAIDAGEPCFIDNLVLCESVWVLRQTYGFSREELIEALQVILSGCQFEFEDKGLILLALQRMRTGRADFADYLIGAVNERAGCTETATFDRKLTRIDGFLKL